MSHLNGALLCVLIVDTYTYVILYKHTYMQTNKQTYMPHKYIYAYVHTYIHTPGGLRVRIHLQPPRRDRGHVLHSQLLIRFGVKLRFSVRAVVGSASE